MIKSVPLLFYAKKNNKERSLKSLHSSSPFQQHQNTKLLHQHIFIIYSERACS
jgi:hypothetical protein